MAFLRAGAPLAAEAVQRGPANMKCCRNGTDGTKCATEVSLGLSAEWEGRAILGELQVKVFELAVC